MTRGSPINWLLLALIGPGLWAAAFASVYALHGLGCALDWQMQDLGGVTLHRLVMLAASMGAVVACLWLLMRLPRGADLTRWLPRIGAWTGLGATIYTLAPLLVATSC